MSDVGQGQDIEIDPDTWYRSDICVLESADLNITLSARDDYGRPIWGGSGAIMIIQKWS